MKYTLNGSVLALGVGLVACQVGIGGGQGASPNGGANPASSPAAPPAPAATQEPRMKPPAQSNRGPTRVTLDGDKIVIKGELKFRVDYAIMDADGAAIMDDLYVLLYEHPEIKGFRVEGHCAGGEKLCDPKVQQNLALTRATIPRTELWERGLSRKSGLKWEESGVLHMGVPEADAPKWRKVEFRVIK